MKQLQYILAVFITITSLNSPTQAAPRSLLELNDDILWKIASCLDPADRARFACGSKGLAQVINVLRRTLVTDYLATEKCLDPQRSLAEPLEAQQVQGLAHFLVNNKLPLSVLYGAHLDKQGIKRPFFSTEQQDAIKRVLRDRLTQLLEHWAEMRRYSGMRGVDIQGRLDQEGREKEISRSINHLLSTGIRCYLRGWIVEIAWMWAVENGHTAFIKDLLDSHGHDLKKRSSMAFICAAGHGYTSMVRYLLTSQKDNISQNLLNHALLRAAYNNHHEKVVQLLLEHGADVNSVCVMNNTALMLVSGRGCKEVVESLLKHGADVNRVDTNGNTALMQAAKYGHTQVVQRLLECGAAVDTRNKWSRTALYYAKIGRHSTTVITLLEEAGP